MELFILFLVFCWLVGGGSSDSSSDESSNEINPMGDGPYYFHPSDTTDEILKKSELNRQYRDKWKD